MNFDDKLEKDIKILINYIIFQKELCDSIVISKTSKYFKCYSNCYLTNVILWHKYHCYQFEQILITLLDDESKKFKPLNNKPITGNIEIINKIYDSFKEYISIYQEYFKESEINYIKSNLDNQNKFNIIFEDIKYDEKIVAYPTDFEIVDEFVFNELNRRFNTFSEKNYLKCEIIVNEGNIIINYEKSHNNRNASSSLLIGEANNDSFFNLKYFINFFEEKNRKEIFGDFLKNSYENINKKYETYFIHVNPNFIQFNDNKMNFDENHIDNKIIKLFLFLFLFEEEIEQNKKNNINMNGNRNYYLINKSWMDIYKNYYDYQNLFAHFEDMKKNKSFNYNYKQLLECINNKNYKKGNVFIYELIKQIPLNILEKLESKKKSQNDLISKINNEHLSINETIFKIETKNKNMFKYIHIYGKNAIINYELFDLFIKLESDEIKKSIKEQTIKIEGLFGENKLFIKSELNPNDSKASYFLLNTGYINRNLFNPSILIYFYKKKDFEEMITYLNNNCFSKYVHNFNLIDNSSCFIQNSEMKNIGKIYRINTLSKEIKEILGNDNVIKPEGMKLLKLILYFIIFNKEIKFPIVNIRKKSGYSVKVDFINEIQKLKTYKIIDEYINKNTNIKEIININFYKSIDELSELVQKQFDIKINKEINNENESINSYTNSYNIDLEYISINKSNYYFANNFILLSEELYSLFKRWAFSENDPYEYFIGSNKVFIINENDKCILVYHIKEKYLLNLEFILYFEYSINPVLNRIDIKNFNNINDLLLLGNNNDIVPIFSSKENKIGYIFKYNYLNRDYTYKHEYPKLKKIFVLYLQYQKLKERKNDKKFNEYYILNKKWLQKYKEYFDFASISKEIEANNTIKDIIKSLTIKDDGDKFISEKKVYLMYKSLQNKIKNNIIEKEEKFDYGYKNSETKIPQLNSLNYLDEKNQARAVFYLDDFEIIDARIYNYLFKNINTEIYTETKFFVFKTGGLKNETKKVLCTFDKNRIIIKLINTDNLIDNPDIKGMLYIGQLNSSFIFEIECLLLYYDVELMNEHIKIIEDSIGFNDFSEQFLYCKINIKVLYVENKVCGIAIKKNQNLFWNTKYNGNDLISKYFTFTPKVGIDKIKNSYFINSILQSFCHTEEFASFFKYNNLINELEKNFSKTKKNLLASSFTILIDKLWPDEGKGKEFSQKSFYPLDFILKIEDMCPIIKNSKSYCSKDFINFIIMTLHEELNQKIESVNINFNSNFNYANSFNIFYQTYLKNFCSKISELFYAIQQTQTQCLNCGNSQYNFQAYFYLYFSLEEVKKYFINKLEEEILNNPIENKIKDKKEKFGNNSENNININRDNNATKYEKEKEKLDKFNNNIISLYDCFEYYQKKDILTDNDQILCNYCAQTVNAEYSSSLTTSPKILILILDRGEHFQTKIKLEFDLMFDIINFVVLKNQSTKYKLISIITYIKEKEDNEQCIAHCLSPIDNKWYTYNDSNVKEVTDIKNEVIDFGLPHILFYERIE